MKSAIAVSARATEPMGAGAICRACGVDCTTVATGRSPRYPSDLRQEQWALVAPLLPKPAVDCRGGGRPEAWCRRLIVDAIFYVADNGCK